MKKQQEDELRFWDSFELTKEFEKEQKCKLEGLMFIEDFRDWLFDKLNKIQTKRRV